MPGTVKMLVRWSRRDAPSLALVGLPGRFSEEVQYPVIEEDVAGFDGAVEPEAVEAGAAAERDVGLAVCEGAAAEVDADAFKGLSLGFVDRDRPGELHGTSVGMASSRCFPQCRQN